MPDWWWELWATETDAPPSLKAAFSENNDPAKAEADARKMVPLYESLGFKQIEIRREYHAGPIGLGL